MRREYIELDNLLLTRVFFELDIEVHTSVDVFNELYPHQQEALNKQNLFLHTITAEDRIFMNTEKMAAGLSQNDRTVLFLAKALNATVLSADNLVRKQAQKQATDCHGMLWVLDQLAGARLITEADAAIKLRQMIAQNIMYQNNMALLKEAGHRLKAWETI